MKKGTFLLAAAVVAALSSCVKGSYSSSYTAASGFEYTNLDQLCGEDGIYYEDVFADNVWYFYNTYKDQKVISGAILSKNADPVYSENHIGSHYAVADTTAGVERGGKACMIYHFNPQADPSTHHTLQFVYSADPGAVLNLTSVFVNNTNKMVNTVLYGDKENNIPSFKQGDYLKIKITGIDRNGNRYSVEKTLAEWKKTEGKTYDSVEADKKENLTYLHDWELVELKDFGPIDFMDFDFVTNRWDLPKYCCFDVFYGKVDINK